MNDEELIKVVDTLDLNLLEIIFNDSIPTIGDVNQDGVVNIHDVIMIIEYLKH